VDEVEFILKFIYNKTCGGGSIQKLKTCPNSFPKERRSYAKKKS
jgi:hypothetical protein